MCRRPGAIPTCVGFLLELQQLIHQEINFFLLKSETLENTKEVIIIIMRKNQTSFEGANAYSKKSQLSCCDLRTGFKFNIRSFDSTLLPPIDRSHLLHFP